MPCLRDMFCHYPASTQPYTLSLHDALPISGCPSDSVVACGNGGETLATPCGSNTWIAESLRAFIQSRAPGTAAYNSVRSEEHTSELQSQFHLVCRLLLEKKKYPV